MCRRPAAERGCVHGFNLQGLHPDVCPQAARGGPGGGASHRLRECHTLLCGSGTGWADLHSKWGQTSKQVTVCAVIVVLLLLYFIQATKEVNNMTVKMPNQCFINGKFEDAENGKVYETINPTDGSVSYCCTNPHTETATHTHGKFDSLSHHRTA